MTNTVDAWLDRMKGKPWIEFTTPDRAVFDPAAERHLLLLLNRARIHHGRAELRESQMVKYYLARPYAMDMVARQFMSHFNPEGLTAFDRAREIGIPFLRLGENLVLEGTVAAAHEGLMQSEGHRRADLERFRRFIGTWCKRTTGRVYRHRRGHRRWRKWRLPFAVLKVVSDGLNRSCRYAQRFDSSDNLRGVLVYGIDGRRCAR